MTGYEIHGDVRLGKNVKVEAGVVLYGPLSIGDGAYIGRNSIIGFPTLKLLVQMLKDHGKIVEGGLGTTIGDNVLIYPSVVIYEGVRIDSNVKVFHNAQIREKVSIGESSIIGSYTVIDGPDVEIGKNTLIHAKCYICSKTKIGDQVFIGPKVGTVNEKSAQSRIGLPSQETYRENEIGPVIEDNAVIGEGAILNMGVVIGKGAVVGTGAVVTKDVPPNEIWIGNPARKLKDRDF